MIKLVPLLCTIVIINSLKIDRTYVSSPNFDFQSVKQNKKIKMYKDFSLNTFRIKGKQFFTKKNNQMSG